VIRAALSHDGRSILISGRGRVVRLWDVATGKAIGPPVVLDGASLVAASFLGQTLAVAGSGGRIVVWNAPEPLAGKVENIRLWVELITGMELDSRGMVSTLGREALRDRQERLDQQGGHPQVLGARTVPD
jgi:hypothetical protein